MMTGFSVTLIAFLITTISQTSAQFTRIIPSERTIPSIAPSQPSKVILSEETILPAEVVSTTEATLLTDVYLSREATLSKEALSTEAPLYTDATLHTEVPLSTEGTFATEATLPRETTLSADATLYTEATLPTESTPSDADTSSIPVTSSILVTPSVGTNPNVGQCLTPLGKDGSCISLHQCRSIFQLLRKQPLLEEDKLYLKSSQCGYKNRMVQVCCPDQEENVVAAQSPSESAKLALLPGPDECGKMSTNRLYGGYTTEFDAFTWSALLEYSKGDNNTGHHCGGTLISNRYVLTAAHCVIGFPKTWSLTHVRLGEWDTTIENECNKYLDYEDCPDPHINVPIERIIPHEKFVPRSRNALYDIALIRLAHTVVTTDFIQPVCLPLGENKRQAFHNQSLDLVGWGANPDGYFNTVKQRASAPVISLGQCREMYARFNVELQDTQFCVEGRLQNDTCRTDSGGAAVGFDTAKGGLGVFHIAGIQSFGLCWLQGYPSVFTRVSEYLDWILENIYP